MQLTLNKHVKQMILWVLCDAAAAITSRVSVCTHTLYPIFCSVRVPVTSACLRV